MGNRKNHRNNKGKGQRGHGRKAVAPPQARPLQGIDQKQFVLNDIVPLTLANPTNSIGLLVIISCDINGYSWSVQETSSAVTVAAGTGLYGIATGQFSTQAMMYTKYYTKSVELDLTLSQGGSVFSLSPIVTLINPSGQDTFVFGTGSGAFQSAISAPQNTQIHQPYTKNVQRIDYSNWLVSNTDRAWRQTLSFGSGRELYPTDSASADPNEDLQLPSMSRSFAVTIPQNVFATGSVSPFILGLFKIRTTYLFSQRRTNIQDLVDLRTQKIREEERKRAYQQFQLLGDLGQKDINDRELQIQYPTISTAATPRQEEVAAPEGKKFM